MKRCCILALLLATAAGAAVAQGKTPIYRCGQTYTQTPCLDGHVIESSDPRSAAQRNEARRVAEREKRLAAESGAASAVPASLAASEPAPAASQAGRKAKTTAKAASAPGAIFITPRPAQK